VLHPHATYRRLYRAIPCAKCLHVISIWIQSSHRQESPCSKNRWKICQRTGRLHQATRSVRRGPHHVICSNGPTVWADTPSLWWLLEER
jgi:hypothetical protein